MIQKVILHQSPGLQIFPNAAQQHAVAAVPTPAAPTALAPQDSQLALPAPPPPAVSNPAVPNQPAPAQQSPEQVLEVVAPLEEPPKAAAVAAIEDMKDKGQQQVPEVSNALQVNAKLEEAMDQREKKKEVNKQTGMKAKKSKVKKPCFMKKPSASLMMKPAAAKSLMKKPSASSASTSASSSGQKPKHSKGPIPSQKERCKLFPEGCSKCRNVPGCCDSCWRQRGFR